MNVYLINPYEEKYLKTVEIFDKIEYCYIELIGDENIIKTLINQKKIKINLLKETIKIINKISDTDLKEYIRTKEIYKSIFIFGKLSDNKMYDFMNLKNKEININNIYVIDIPKLKHFLFLTVPYKRDLNEFNNRRKGMNVLYKFMNLLGIMKANVALIANNLDSIDMIECNLIKMILKDNMNKQIGYINYCKIKDIFNIHSVYNIFDTNLNCILFLQNDGALTFIEMLELFTNYRIGKIKEINGTYFINAKEIKDEENIVFTILLIGKCLSLQDFTFKISNQ